MHNLSAENRGMRYWGTNNHPLSVGVTTKGNLKEYG